MARNAEKTASSECATNAASFSKGSLTIEVLSDDDDNVIDLSDDEAGGSWTKSEDRDLCKSWIEVSTDPTKRNHKLKPKNYWGKVLKQFEKRQQVEGSRDWEALESRWEEIKDIVNVFVGHYHRLNRFTKYSKEHEEIMKETRKFYLSVEEHEFTLEHCYYELRDLPLFEDILKHQFLREEKWKKSAVNNNKDSQKKTNSPTIGNKRTINEIQTDDKDPEQEKIIIEIQSDDGDGDNDGIDGDDDEKEEESESEETSSETLTTEDELELKEEFSRKKIWMTMEEEFKKEKASYELNPDASKKRKLKMSEMDLDDEKSMYNVDILSVSPCSIKSATKRKWYEREQQRILDEMKIGKKFR